MPSWTSFHIAACVCLSVFAWHVALPEAISGSIRFGDENFELEVRTLGSSLPLSARGCSNFDLSFASAAPGAALELQNAKGIAIGTVGASKIVEARTCKADRYLTEFVFAAPTTTQWHPHADESLGTKKVRYAANLAPTEIRFEPAIELTIFDQNKRVRPIRVAGVARARLQGEAQLAFSSDALHFRTAGALIRRDGGFTGSDLFSLSTQGRPLTPPEVGRGSEIALDADSEEPASLSLYYPSRGPHVLAFFKDEAQGLATALGSLRVDGTQRLMPELTVVRTDTLTLERGPFDFVVGTDQFVTGSIVLSIGKTGIEVRDIELHSNSPELNFGDGASADGTRTLSYATVAGGVPFEVPLRMRVPISWNPGEHSIAVAVSSEGGLRRQIPLTVSVIDRHSTTRIALLAVLAAIVIAIGASAVAKRRKAQSQEAAMRTRFIQRHYDDYARYRERVEGLGAFDSPEWSDVESLLREFVHEKLHSGLPPAQWHAIDEAAKQRQARETLQALERALARFEA